MSKPDRSYDAHLKAMDFDELGNRGPDGMDFVYGWRSDDPTLSSEERDLFDAIVDEAHDRYDVTEFDHQETVAEIWLEESEIEHVEWVDEDQ